MAKKELSFITEKLSTIQARLDNAMAREVQLESEMVQEKRARLDECRGSTIFKSFFLLLRVNCVFSSSFQAIKILLSNFLGKTVRCRISV